MKKVCLIIIPAILACAFPFFGTAGTINMEAYVEDGRVKKTVTIKEILDSLELRYDIRFVYDSSIASLLDTPGKAEGSTLEKALESLFSGTGIGWKIQKNTSFSRRLLRSRLSNAAATRSLSADISTIPTPGKP